MSIREAREVLSEGPVLVAYRWMADQFLAATLLAGWLRERGVEAGFLAFTEITPTMDLLERIARTSRSYKAVALLGSGFNGVEVDLLASNILAPLVVVDSSVSRQEPRRPNVLYFNPAPKGDPRGTWPTVAFTLGALIGRATSLLVAASVASILGRASIAVRAYQNSMASHGLNHVEDYFIAEECASRAIAVTSIGDPAIMARFPESIVEASMGDECKAILDDALLAQHWGMLEAVLEQAEVEDRECCTIMRVEGVRHSALLRLTSETAISRSRAAIAVSGRSFCAWSPAREPLYRRLTGLRGQGAPYFAVYQGMVNYACGELRDGRALQLLAARLAG